MSNLQLALTMWITRQVPVLFPQLRFIETPKTIYFDYLQILSARCIFVYLHVYCFYICHSFLGTNTRLTSYWDARLWSHWVKLTVDILDADSLESLTSNSYFVYSSRLNSCLKQLHWIRLPKLTRRRYYTSCDRTTSSFNCRTGFVLTASHEFLLLIQFVDQHVRRKVIILFSTKNKRS